MKPADVQGNGHFVNNALCFLEQFKVHGKIEEGI